MPPRRYEVRVRGRLSPRVRDAFPGMDVEDVPAQTIIAGTATGASDLYDVLALIQSLGLRVVEIDQVVSGAAPRGTRSSPVDEAP